MGTYQWGGFIRYPGQVPGKSLPLSMRPRLDPEIERSLTAPPPGVTLDRMLDRPVLRAQDAVSNLGLTKALESTLSLSIQKEAAKSINQLVFQKAINATMMETGLPPDLQAVINARASRFFRSSLQKSARQEVYTLEEIATHYADRIREAARHARAGAGEKLMLMEKASERYDDPQVVYPKLRRPGEKKRVKDLQKAGTGEGSKGGHVIGHYPSGKPIYGSPHEKEALHSEEHPHGDYHVLHHGAGIHALYFKTKKERKAKNIGNFSSLDAAKQGIKHHTETGYSKPSSIGSEINPEAKWLKKAFEPGGKYVARVTHPKTGKQKYYYDEEKYKKEHGEHVSGEQARLRHVHSEVERVTTEAGPGGHDVTGYRDLVKKFGAKPVHDAVRTHVDGGTINFQAGKFTAKPAKKEVKKSFFILE